VLIPRVLVTGASGFVGRELCQTLARSGICPVPVTRRSICGPIGGQDPVVVGGIGVDTDWSRALTGSSVVVHLAARVHVMHETLSDLLGAYRDVNTHGTLNFAHQAAASGVRRFVFVSTVKVNGEGGTTVYSESTPPGPADPYAISKWEAEQGLRVVAKNSGMEVVIIRPPLVYGPGVKANFLSMMRWLHRGIPLPFGAIHNKRSLVAVGNLVDLLITCLDHPAAANQTFLVGDDEDLSTTELLERMAAALGKPARLIPLPSWVILAGAALLDKRDLYWRLCGSLRVDISKSRELLGWSPPVSVDEGLRLTAAHYLATASR